MGDQGWYYPPIKPDTKTTDWDVTGDLHVYGNSYLDGDVYIGGTLYTVDELEIEEPLITTGAVNPGDTKIGGVITARNTDTTSTYHGFIRHNTSNELYGINGLTGDISAKTATQLRAGGGKLNIGMYDVGVVEYDDSAFSATSPYTSRIIDTIPDTASGFITVQTLTGVTPGPTYNTGKAIHARTDFKRVDTGGGSILPDVVCREYISHEDLTQKRCVTEKGYNNTELDYWQFRSEEGDSPQFRLCKVGGTKTDVINELTPDAGVTIEGVLIKDGVVSGPKEFIAVSTQTNKNMIQNVAVSIDYDTIETKVGGIAFSAPNNIIISVGGYYAVSFQAYVAGAIPTFDLELFSFGGTGPLSKRFTTDSGNSTVVTFTTLMYIPSGSVSAAITDYGGSMIVGSASLPTKESLQMRTRLALVLVRAA